MMGGPIDLTPFGAALQAIGIAYWLIAVVMLVLAVRGPKRGRDRVIAVALVVALFGFLPGRIGWQEYQARNRLNAAMARFEMRCKSAGEKINRTMENVDGVVWMKWRPTGNNPEQFALDDPYGKDCSGDECIKRLLRVTKGVDLNPDDAKENANGHRFVETIDPSDGKRYRYFGVMKLHPRWTEQAIARQKELTGKGLGASAYPFSLEREPIANFTARYGITWDDISTREDREQWIAGGSLKAIDLQNNEVLAERVGYLIDPGQGSTAGFRDPWGWAHSSAPRCPRIDERTWEFATRVLQPKKQGE